MQTKENLQGLRQASRATLFFWFRFVHTNIEITLFSIAWTRDQGISAMLFVVHKKGLKIQEACIPYKSSLIKTYLERNGTSWTEETHT
jgi:hypothetical protein